MNPMFSPRTRGCSGFWPHVGACERVFPAHAGMFPSASNLAFQDHCFPRARGDVPVVVMIGDSTIWVFPAHAGMFPICHLCGRDGASFPRARGDVPATTLIPYSISAFSPRTRGCS